MLTKSHIYTQTHTGWLPEYNGLFPNAPSLFKGEMIPRVGEIPKLRQLLVKAGTILRVSKKNGRPMTNSIKK